MLQGPVDLAPESGGKEVKVLQGPVDLAVGNRRSSRAVVSSVRTTRIDVGVSDSTALPPRDASVAPHTTPGAPVGPIAVTPARASVEPHTTPDALVASSTPVTGEPKSLKRPRENSAVAVYDFASPPGASPVAIMVLAVSGRSRRDASTCRCCALMLLGFVGFACVNAPG